MTFPFIGTVLGQETVSLHRDTVTQTWGSDGRPAARLRTLVSAAVQASVQPLSGREFQILELGGRLADYVKIYTETELRAGDNQAVAKPRGDTVTLADGTVYLIVQVMDYGNGPYPHHKGIGRRIDESNADGGA